MSISRRDLGRDLGAVPRSRRDEEISAAKNAPRSRRDSCRDLDEISARSRKNFHKGDIGNSDELYFFKLGRI